MTPAGFGATVLRRQEQVCMARDELPHGKTFAAQVRLKPGIADA
jgi:hypothetical protein